MRAPPISWMQWPGGLFEPCVRMSVHPAASSISAIAVIMSLSIARSFSRQRTSMRAAGIPHLSFTFGSSVTRLSS